MIKRIQLIRQYARELDMGWLRRSSPAATEPPLRAAICLVLHEVQGCDAPYDAMAIEWFRDSATLGLHQHEGTCLIAEELVLRGADWLAQRWTDPRPKYKHMALARRAAGLSAHDFSDRWRNRPGRIGGAGTTPAVSIPESARGHAYIQNHPLHTHTPDPAYDAINEVYFDDLAAMQSRLDFFAQHDVLQADADFIGHTCFAVVVEHMVL